MKHSKLKSIFLYLLIIGSITILSSCTSNEKKIWIFELDQSKKSVEKELASKDFKYETKNDTINIKKEIELYGITWEACNLYFKNDSLYFISFNTSSGKEISKDQKKNLVEDIDQIYGEHTTDTTAKSQFGTVQWEWKKNNIKVLFISLFWSKYASLMFIDDTKIKKQDL